MKNKSGKKRGIWEKYFLEPIFSGDNSKKMWDEINKAKTIYDLRWALYNVCCHFQTLETRIEYDEAKLQRMMAEAEVGN
jgi:hypothetical protein